MSAWVAVLVFAGIPAGIFGTIFAAVALTSGGERPHNPFAVVGLVREGAGCVAGTDDAQRRVHEPQPGTDPTCFTARCAECGEVYRDGVHDVHFTSVCQGVDIVTSQGWRLAGPRLRCPRCR
ncbi:MAG: hypothetical protein NTW05_16545 [Pseudonocardiales bacterium]|nr:hypothetical protein [Pseudonocardiales bacterium]